ncbi:type II toxin-antitoxin system VapC family toxin [Methanobrevibacter sp.]
MKGVFLDTSFILAYVNSNDVLHTNALRLQQNENVLAQNCYINNNVLNEVLTVAGRKLNVHAAEEIYYGLIDSFDILNEYDIFNYTGKTFDIFKRAGANNEKKGLSFTDSSIVLTMSEKKITDLVSFDRQFRGFRDINLIGPDYL